MDCFNPQISHGEILEAIAKESYALIIFLARPDTVRAITKILPLTREISPKSKILIYGDTANYFPNFFKKSGADAVIVSGDWECGLDDYFDFLIGKKNLNQLEGIICNIDGVWTNSRPGRKILDNNWSLPDIKTPGFIDKELYYSINKGQLTITVSRGCPFDCNFCPAVITFGIKDRRVSHEKIINYIKYNKAEFQSLKFFSPTFTYDKAWVKELCRLMIKHNCIVQWSCTSRPDCLDDIEMVELMAKSGCNKVALGVETLDTTSRVGLKKFHKISGYIDLVKNVFSDLSKNRIEPKPLMMLGIKGQTRKNIKKSFELLNSFGAKEIRAASYSPRQILLPKDRKNLLKIEDIEKMDKMTYQHIELPGINREEYLKLIYDTNNYRNILK